MSSFIARIAAASFLFYQNEKIQRKAGKSSKKWSSKVLHDKYQLAFARMVVFL